MWGSHSTAAEDSHGMQSGKYLPALRSVFSLEFPAH